MWKPLIVQTLATAVGIWIILSASVLGYVGTPPASNDRIIGPFIVCFAIVAFNEATRNVRWWNVPLGLWMLLAAVLFDYPTDGRISAIAAGLATIALPWVPRKPQVSFGGGWWALFRFDPYLARNSSADDPANPDATPTDIDMRTEYA